MYLLCPGSGAGVPPLRRSRLIERPRLGARFLCGQGVRLARYWTAAFTASMPLASICSAWLSSSEAVRSSPEARRLRLP